MRRKTFIIIILLFFASFSVASSQELEDIHTAVRQITDFFKTPQGTIIYYSSTKIDSEALYIPTSWFFPLKNRPQQEASDGSRPIVARIYNLQFNLNSPFIELEYINKELRNLNIYLTKDQINANTQYLPRDLRNQDLVAKFKDQESKNFIVIK